MCLPHFVLIVVSVLLSLWRIGLRAARLLLSPKSAEEEQKRQQAEARKQTREKEARERRRRAERLDAVRAKALRSELQEMQGHVRKMQPSPATIILTIRNLLNQVTARAFWSLTFSSSKICILQHSTK